MKEASGDSLLEMENEMLKKKVEALESSNKALLNVESIKANKEFINVHKIFYDRGMHISTDVLLTHMSIVYKGGGIIESIDTSRKEFDMDAEEIIKSMISITDRLKE